MSKICLVWNFSVSAVVGLDGLEREDQAVGADAVAQRLEELLARVLVRLLERVEERLHRLLVRDLAETDRGFARDLDACPARA